MLRGAKAFDKTLTKSSAWIAEMMKELQVEDELRAYRGLRAGLHALRDRLGIEEAADLAAQLPLLIRGLFYEGWRPVHKPDRMRTAEDFYDRIRRETTGDALLEPERVARAVIRVLASHISQGELEDIHRSLPRDLAQLWGQNLGKRRESGPAHEGA